MRNLLAYFLILPVAGLTAVQARAGTPPPKIVFAAKNGAVAFDHSAHAKREKGSCQACHTALFAQDAKAPLGFRPPHKTSEDKRASCGSCHRAGGSAFESKGACANGKCHALASAKK